MPAEIDPSSTQPQATTNSLENILLFTIEGYLAEAMNSGTQTFELAPGFTVGVDELSNEYIRRASASEFNRR